MKDLKCLKNELNEINTENEKFTNQLIMKYQDRIIEILEEEIKKAMMNKEMIAYFQVGTHINNCLVEEFGEDYQDVLKIEILFLDSPKKYIYDKFKSKIAKILKDKGFYIFRTASDEDYIAIMWSKKTYILVKIADYIVCFFKKIEKIFS
ncbi:hypothetical protein H9660_11990 [Clostridium sp. Sa3CUN1]|uniref:Uncharacterized protein n=1 Tax=Clostridium gallinarum TaxID=2762246 RepID=A0ABR8Q642_9CLOT|nr:hypothetical protein [Clostridium gallinarum]MBD7915865.1 hypothetical protein [Clostridium gallinarum]